MTEPVRLSIIDPDDSCQSVLCSRIGGRCVGSHCGRCGAPSSHQGHYSSVCRHKPISQPFASNAPFHFCCPDDCELTSRLSGEALRDLEERDDAAGDLP